MLTLCLPPYPSLPYLMLNSLYACLSFCVLISPLCKQGEEPFWEVFDIARRVGRTLHPPVFNLALHICQEVSVRLRGRVCVCMWVYVDVHTI